MNKPIKPEITIPESFAENGIKTDFTAEQIQNGFDNLRPEVLNGDNLNKFIDDTYKGLNYSMVASDALNILEDGHTLVYEDGEIKSKLVQSIDDKITNCILEAPNGVATYSGNTITLKAGLKVLMPDGLNADGTLKNIEYTLENDVNVVRGQLKTQIAIFLKSDGEPNDAFFYQVVNNYSDITTNLCLYYVINENNIYYRNSQGSISKIICAYIGDATTDGTTITSNITDLTTQKPINLLTMSNKNIISGWGMPSNKYIDLTLGASGSTYTAPANGWFWLAKLSASNQAGYIYFKNITKNYDDISWKPTTSGAVHLFMKVSKGDKVLCNYTVTGNIEGFRFIYAEGEVS